MAHTYFLYIAKHAGRNLLKILLAITLIITLIDYLKHADEISTRGNQAILYLFYTWEFRLSQFYPLAIVFASVLSHMSFVRMNTWVSLRTFGYTGKQLLLPFFLPAVMLYASLLWLQAGEFSYAREKAWSILHHAPSARIVDDLFFKYNDTFVYIKKLDPIQKVLEEVTVFSLKKHQVERTVTLNRALFDGKQWVAENALEIKKTYTNQGIQEGFQRRVIDRYIFLKGYRPKVIELLYEGNSLSLRDIFHTYAVLRKQNLDTNKIKATFYNKVCLPLFSLAIVTILFFKIPYFVRYMHQELVLALSLGGTLLLWGLLYALYSLSMGGAVSADIAVLFPVLLLLVYALSLYVREKEKLS